jgi:hypothetical protein
MLTRATRDAILPGVRTWLLTGVVPDQSVLGSFEAFLLSKPGSREARSLWLEHRDEILSDWHAQRRPGLPWAEKHLAETDDDGPEAA